MNKFDIVIPVGPNDNVVVKNKYTILKKILSDIEIYI